MSMQLTTAPSVNIGLLIRRPPHTVFEALADPSITTRFWYTKSSGRMTQGADLEWQWEMYGVSTTVHVQTVEPDRLIRFTWGMYDKERPSTVEFRLIPYQGDTYLRVVETGFTGDADNQVKRAVDSTGGFTFVISALKAALEHDVTLSVTADAFRSDLEE
ncbi:activator of hsp90 ATPase 1-like protein [Pochonia chlamydosporia 170]|uniref:Activator of hsp90 ATPase 1-like protein n=1 Tax=Pochonia chlamydosporia 170 TaxID=1380566 RepID=A0A179FEK8_METCM|nr:activator of hsp90 ATPase 1-like protein [Pochonia chlamydosporia 170]OAQ64025.1 activator of hsp90 ATPase 1-like protein [Pochonia chlamydosporia 170]